MHAMDDLLAAALGQISVLDERSAAVRLGDFWAKRAVALALVRHLGCLFCRQQVADLMRRLPEIERRSATLVVVGPSRPEHIAAFRPPSVYAGALFLHPRSQRLCGGGPSRPDHAAAVRAASEYAGPLSVDPSLRAFRAAGLEHSRAST